MIFIGIDPGLTGAVAVLDETGNILSVQDTPTLLVRKGKASRNTYVESQMATIIGDAITATEDRILAVIEAVHSMPAQGVRSTFSLGTGFGIWLGILAALRVPTERVEPMVWKKRMGIPTGSDKNASIICASRKFPKADLFRKKDHGRADALLLAEFLRQRTVKIKA